MAVEESKSSSLFNVENLRMASASFSETLTRYGVSADGMYDKALVVHSTLRTRVENVDFGQFFFAVLQKVFVKLGEQALQVFRVRRLGRRGFLYDLVQHFFHVLHSEKKRLRERRSRAFPSPVAAEEHTYLVVDVLFPPFRRDVRLQVFGELHVDGRYRRGTDRKGTKTWASGRERVLLSGETVARTAGTLENDDGKNVN